jgi:hypothetical protein
LRGLCGRRGCAENGCEKEMAHELV